MAGGWQGKGRYEEARWQREWRGGCSVSRPALRQLSVYSGSFLVTGSRVVTPKQAGLREWSYGSGPWACLLHTSAPSSTQPRSSYWGGSSGLRTGCAAAAAPSVPTAGPAAPLSNIASSESSEPRLRSSDLRSPPHVLKLNMLGGDASRRFAKRVGRGIGSGKGKTAGRGGEGQRARATPRVCYDQLTTLARCLFQGLVRLLRSRVDFRCGVGFPNVGFITLLPWIIMK